MRQIGRRGLAAGGFGALAIGALIATGFGSTRAQEEDLPSGAAAGLPTGEIVAGTCDALGEPLYQVDGSAGGDDGVGERVGPGGATAMLYSISELDARFDDLLAAPHALVVPPSAVGAPVACGDIGGFVDDDGLAIGLGQPEGSGLSGVAMLWDDDDRVEVELYLAEGVAAGDPGDG